MLTTTHSFYDEIEMQVTFKEQKISMNFINNRVLCFDIFQWVFNRNGTICVTYEYLDTDVFVMKQIQVSFYFNDSEKLINRTSLWT